MHITKFFYNVDTKECEFFVYSGCGGNANNFMSAVECQSTCKKGSTVLIQVPMAQPPPKHSNKSAELVNSSSAEGNKSKEGALKKYQHIKRTLSAIESAYFSFKNVDAVARSFVLDGEDCKQSEHGCCDDENSPATGANKQGCVECIYFKFFFSFFYK